MAKMIKTTYRVQCLSPFRNKAGHEDKILEINADSQNEAIELAKDQIGDAEGAAIAEQYEYRAIGLEES